MKILVTGATGLIGTELVPLLLSSGHEVNYLSTSKQKLTIPNFGNGYYWNPDKGQIDESALIGVDAIINLSGASIAKRWSDKYKQEIIESRTFTSNLLYKTLKNNPHQVRLIVSASAIGIYRDSLTAVYQEDFTDVDDSFLGRVVTKWEAGAEKFRGLGIRVCKLRTGLVLSAKGGALPEISAPIAKGIGAHFGSGKQIQSWIHIEDLARMYAFAIETNLEGTFNAVAPNPVTNKEMTRTIADALHKPLVLPGIPKFVMSIAFGEMHSVLYASQNASARRIMDAGFSFRFRELKPAVEDLLQKKAP